MREVPKHPLPRELHRARRYPALLRRIWCPRSVGLMEAAADEEMSESSNFNRKSSTALLVQVTKIRNRNRNHERVKRGINRLGKHKPPREAI